MVTKIRAAREALEHMRPAEMKAARATLKHLAGNPAKAYSSGPAPTPACVVKLDRL